MGYELWPFPVENAQFWECVLVTLLVPSIRFLMNYLDQKKSYIFVIDNFFVQALPKELWSF